MGRHQENSHSGTRTRAVRTEMGPVEFEVPRDLLPSDPPFAERSLRMSSH